MTGFSGLWRSGISISLSSNSSMKCMTGMPPAARPSGKAGASLSRTWREARFTTTPARKTMLDAQALRGPVDAARDAGPAKFSACSRRITPAPAAIPERELRWLDLLARQAADLIERRRADHAPAGERGTLSHRPECRKNRHLRLEYSNRSEYLVPELEQLYGLAPGSFAGTQQAWEKSFIRKTGRSR